MRAASAPVIGVRAGSLDEALVGILSSVSGKAAMGSNINNGCMNERYLRQRRWQKNRKLSSGVANNLKRDSKLKLAFPSSSGSALSFIALERLQQVVHLMEALFTQLFRVFAGAVQLKAYKFLHLGTDASLQDCAR